MQRTEPVAKVNEFSLAEIGTGNDEDRKTKVSVEDLLQTLNVGKKQRITLLEKSVKQARKRGQTLDAPLEKPQAERVRSNAALNTSLLLECSNNI